MSEKTVLPKARKARRLPALPAVPAPYPGGSGSDIARRREGIGRISARQTKTRPGPHTEGSRARRALIRLRRLPVAIPALLREEAAHGHGFLFVPVAIGAGAVCWFNLPNDPAFWPYLVATLVFGAAAIAIRHRTGILPVAVAGLALFLSGMMLAELESWRRSTTVLDSPVTTEIIGRVERREMDALGRWRYLVRLEKTANPEVRRPPERITLLARSRHDPAEIGDDLSGRARLSPPSGPALPGLHDFAFSSYFDGIGAVGFFYGAPKRQAGGTPSGPFMSRVEAWLFDLRSEIATRIRKTVPGDAGAFAAAIVTDERRAISEKTTEALRLSGLAHIVAISGLNMALAAGIFFVGVRTVLSLFTGFAQAYPVKKIAAFGALLMATAYYLISGFGVSAERAYIMMAVMLVAVFFDRPSISLRNVALSALIILALSPSEILGPSFQMSFAATVALVAGYAMWMGRGAGREREAPVFRHPAVTSARMALGFMTGILSTSLIGSVSTAIYSVEHFHRLATYGLAANLAAMPIISFLVMPAGLLGMLLMPFGLEGPCLRLMGLGLEAVIAVAKYVAAWGGDVGIGRQHPWFLALATVGFLLLTLFRTRLRIAGAPILAVALLLSWLDRGQPRPDLLVAEDGVMVALIEDGSVMTNRTKPPDFIYGQWKRALLIGDPEKPAVLKPEKPPPEKPSSDTRLPDRPVPDRPVPDKPRKEQNVEAPAAEQQSSQQSASKTRERLTPEMLVTSRKRMEQARAGNFLCEPRAWCVTVSRGGIIVIAVEDGRYAGLACDVAHLVIAPRAGFDTCRSDALMINGRTLRRTGALEIFVGDSPDRSGWRINPSFAGDARDWTRHRQYDWRQRTFDPSVPEPVLQLISDNGE